MNTKFIITLDKTIVRFFGLLLNYVVIIVGKILRLDHSLDKNFDTIIVAKYKGMGSIVQTIPLLHGLRNTYPNANIIFVSSIGNLKVLEGLKPLIDKTILLNDRSFFNLLFNLPYFIYQLIKARSNVFIDLEIYSNASSLLTTLSLSTNRFGYFLRSDQYRKGLYSHMIFFNLNTPVSENYKQMGRLIGISNFNELRSIEILTKKPRNIKEKYIVINANASDLRLERRWPLQKYASLIDRIQETDTHTIILIGGGNEVEHINQLEQLLKTKRSVVNLAGKSSFNELISLIQHADLVVTNDTGPMHLSFLFKVKTIALFGPCHPAHYGIDSEQVAIHYTNTYCSPCVHEFEVAPCNGDNVCMKTITVDAVMNSYTALMEGKRIKYLALPVLYNNKNETLGVVSRS